jgi:hypothetical protein
MSQGIKMERDSHSPDDDRILEVHWSYATEIFTEKLGRGFGGRHIGRQRRGVVYCLPGRYKGGR